MANKESKESKEPKAQAEAAKPAKPKSKSKMILVLGAAFLLVGGAGGFFGWKHFSKANAAAHAEEQDDHSEESEGHGKEKKTKKKKAKEAAEEGATISFEPFLVNLADKEASRYLKTSVRLLVREKEAAETIAKGDVLMPRLRDTILTILSSKTAAEVTTNEGKEKLKQEILSQVNEYLPNEDAKEVFFTDFVVQL